MRDQKEENDRRSEELNQHQIDLKETEQDLENRIAELEQSEQNFEQIVIDRVALELEGRINDIDNLTKKRDALIKDLLPLQYTLRQEVDQLREATFKYQSAIVKADAIYQQLTATLDRIESEKTRVYRVDKLQQLATQIELSRQSIAQANALLARPTTRIEIDGSNNNVVAGDNARLDARHYESHITSIRNNNSTNTTTNNLRNTLELLASPVSFFTQISPSRTSSRKGKRGRAAQAGRLKQSDTPSYPLRSQSQKKPRITLVD